MKKILLALSIFIPSLYSCNQDSKELELIKAVKDGNLDIVKQLLNKNLKINTKDKKGRTALIYAAFYNHKHILKLLLNAGADIEVADENRQTALMHATKKENKEIVELLLDYNADASRQDYFNHSALYYANEDIKTLIYKYLLDYQEYKAYKEELSKKEVKQKKLDDSILLANLKYNQYFELVQNTLEDEGCIPQDLTKKHILQGNFENFSSYFDITNSTDTNSKGS